MGTVSGLHTDVGPAGVRTALGSGLTTTVEITDEVTQPLGPVISTL
jgi:hypothetical protein